MTDKHSQTVIPGLTALNEVDLRATKISNGTLNAMSALDYLEILDVRETKVSSQGVASFMGSKCRMSLKELYIGLRSDWSKDDRDFVVDQAFVCLRKDATMVV